MSWKTCWWFVAVSGSEWDNRVLKLTEIIFNCVNDVHNTIGWCRVEKPGRGALPEIAGALLTLTLQAFGFSSCGISNEFSFLAQQVMWSWQKLTFILIVSSQLLMRLNYICLWRTRCVCHWQWHCQETIALARSLK